MIADLRGAGCVKHIWMTLAGGGPAVLREVVLRMHWDGQDEPSVECPLGDFFGMGHGLAKNFVSLPLQMSPAHGARIRQQVVERVQSLVDQTDRDGFDIDAVSDMDLDVPQMPASPLRLEMIDNVLRRPDLLPPGVECRPLDAGTYALRMPGTAEQIRVTASRQVFDEHFESHQLLTYGGAVMDALLIKTQI